MSEWRKLLLPWQACIELAWEAYCDDCLPIGAVVTNAEGAILSRGRNRIRERKTTPGKHGRKGQLAHAEVEALQAVDFDTVDPHGCALFTGTEPCPMCMGALYMSGVRTLHFASHDPWAGSSNLLGSTWYLSVKPVKVFPPMDEKLELVLMGMFVAQDLERNGEATLEHRLYERWREHAPRSVLFGTMVYEQKLMKWCQQNNVEVSEMFNLLASKLDEI
jgi:tRNA(Arg) A34 adenosine deaminase TadA